MAHCLFTYRNSITETAVVPYDVAVKRMSQKDPDGLGDHNTLRPAEVNLRHLCCFPRCCWQIQSFPGFPRARAGFSAFNMRL